MADMQDIGRFTAGGYSFYTEKDAVLAENELMKIKYMESRLDYRKPASIFAIYNKAIDEHVFKSPVGYHFLKKLQQFLLDSPEVDSATVRPIPLHVSFDGEFRGQPNPAKSRVKPTAGAQPKKSSALPFSIILNIILVVAILAMFVITMNADQPNVLNYERVITNRYASWEQELTEREKTVREKERELNITE